jgi:maleylpyruvate isomerase
MIKLYDYFRSSAAFRVRLALNYKQLPYEKIKINLLDGAQLTPEYAKLNPSGLVPVLGVGDNETVHQSLAILEYLNEEYPNNPLLPKGALDRAYVRALALDVACDIHPLNNLRVLKYLKNELKHDQETVDKWYHHWVHKGLSGIEQSLKNSKLYTGKYCYKDQFSMADVCLLPQLVNGRRFGGDISMYSTLMAIEQTCQKHDFVMSAYPGEE